MTFKLLVLKIVFSALHTAHFLVFFQRNFGDKALIPFIGGSLRNPRQIKKAGVLHRGLLGLFLYVQAIRIPPSLPRASPYTCIVEAVIREKMMASRELQKDD
jgi:hypothetical protein